jgi:hypothetical protein
MKHLSRHYRLAGAVLGYAVAFSTANLLAQGTPLLQITTIQVAPGNPVRFDFADTGTGATNYVVEFSPVVGGAWSNITAAVITPLGGGAYRVSAPDPFTGNGFFRVRGVGGPGIVASFASTAFQVTEGGMVSPTLTFSAPLFGLVRYTVSGTAASGDYVSLSGEVFVNGTTATIPVSLLDNKNIGQLRYLTLSLQAGAGYRVGASSQTTITIDENDAEWQGRFTTDAASIGFVLRIQESNGVKMASLKSEGFGLFPTNEITAALLSTANEFAATVNDIPTPAGATLLNEPMSLSLFLSAMNGLTNQSVTAAQVQGVGTLISAVPAKPFLNTTNFGTFLLLKPPVKPSTNQVELADAP